MNGTIMNGTIISRDKINTTPTKQNNDHRMLGEIVAAKRSRMPPPPSLPCNLCQKPLATTCFLCTCDCVFCEESRLPVIDKEVSSRITHPSYVQLISLECTYSHFEQSSSCPICRRVLTENDFTELVVAEKSSNENNVSKSYLQALFSKPQSNNHGNYTTKALPFSDACSTLIRQLDAMKSSTKFLLKQLLMHGNTQTRKFGYILRINESLKHQVTNLKQEHSTQRIRYEQVNKDLKHKLLAKDHSIQELHKNLEMKENMLDQFRRIHGGCDKIGIIEKGPQKISNDPRNSDNGRLNRRSEEGIRSNSYQSHPEMDDLLHETKEPPWKRGLFMQRQGHEFIAQQSFETSRRENVLSFGTNHNNHPSVGDPEISRPINRSNGAGGYLYGNAFPRKMNNTEESIMRVVRKNRLPSSHSIGSNSMNSLTPRVRDLTCHTGFKFSGGRSGSYQRQRLNKRRRTKNTQLGSQFMSPNTPFTLNQGPHRSTGGVMTGIEDISL